MIMSLRRGVFISFFSHGSAYAFVVCHNYATSRWHHAVLFYYSQNMYWRVQIMKLIMKFLQCPFTIIQFIISPTTLFSEGMWINDWKCVVIFGWFILSLLGGLCCRLWVVRFAIIGRVVLSSSGGPYCHYWVVCVVFGWCGVKPEVIQ